MRSPSVREDVSVLLLSGMATDERLFEPQLARFPGLHVPAWIEPLPRESLRAYAARLSRSVDPGSPCIVGGASFGGIVALEMAPHLRAAACILIGSIRSPSELPWRWRMLRPLAALGPDRLGMLSSLAASCGHWWFKPGTIRRLRRLSQPQSAFTRWAMCALLRWQPSPASRRVRVYQIHGEADRTLPVERTRPDVIVPSGAHALPLFHPEAVSEFIAGVLQRVTTAQHLP